jgi:two-component system response regulator QseB
MDILLIEDDLDLGNGVRIALDDIGMRVVWVRRLEDAQRHIDIDQFDLILLDQGLPDGEGLQLLTRLRQRQDKIPVLILSARDALSDRVRGLDSGADDYLVKPFELAELISRVRALGRRSYGFAGDLLEVRGLSMQVSTRCVSVNTVPVSLTPSEFSLLKTLLMRVDRVQNRHTLEESVPQRGQVSASNSLDVHIGNLRRKLGEQYIRTVRGVGFVIDQQAVRGRQQ